MKWKITRSAQVLPIALIGLLGASPSQAGDARAQEREPEPMQRIDRNDKGAVALPGQTVRAPLPGIATELAQATPPASSRQGSDGGRPAARPAPGAFVVDEEAAQRALERTLTQSGALLLPQGTVEFTPSYTYRRNEQTTSSLVGILDPATSATVPVVATQRNWQNENTLRADIRVGLPFSTQLELGVPYTHMRTTQSNNLGASTSSNGNGLGDASFGIAKTLARESGAWPDLIGRLTYGFGNGKQQDRGVLLNGGFRQATAELVALKRQDPLAFVANAFYSKSFEENAIKPGDALGVSLTAVLAASPATSLQFGFSQIYRKKQENNGVKLAGSEQTYGIAGFGASSVLSRDVTLVTQLGIGMGNDAPKYSFSISLPILFR